MSEAATIWSPQLNQEGEFAQVAVSNLTDPVTTTINITDPVDGSIIVDTGVTFTNIPATVFSFNPGI
jgi:hypothetical protein